MNKWNDSISKRAMRRVMYVAVSNKQVFKLHIEDFKEYSDESLKIGETSLLTFQQAIESGFDVGIRKQNETIYSFTGEPVFINDAARSEISQRPLRCQAKWSGQFRQALLLFV